MTVLMKGVCLFAVATGLWWTAVHGWWGRFAFFCFLGLVWLCWVFEEYAQARKAAGMWNPRYVRKFRQRP